MSGLATFARRTAGKPWIWSYVGAFVVWVAIVVFTGGKASGGVLTAALAFGTFFALVAIGQMFVITLGPGNVDLSIPSTMVLSGTVALKAMNGDATLIPVGFALAILVGLGVGVANFGLIKLLRIPPIIATLSSSLIILSMAIAWNRGLRIAPPDALGSFTTTNVWGVPVLAVLVILLAAAMHVVLSRTIFGRSATAIGQNQRAAMLAGVKVERVRFISYVMCATFAAVTGFLLASFSGGTSLDMGETYLLTSIAVVVIGGTSVAGGFSNVPGLWGAALFLFLLQTMLNTFGFGAGPRLISTGVIVILVIVAASFRNQRT